MIQHVVLWKLLEGANDKSKKENFDRIREALSTLPALIPQIRSLTVVKNENLTDKNMDVALITSFDNMEDLDAYVIHPEHVKVGRFIGTVVSFRSAIDYRI